MQSLRQGDLLEIFGDDPAIREDMPEWCARAGHRLVEMTDEAEGRIRTLVEKGAPRPRRLRRG
jgi:tRNA 2-thiouridine synthesizing protein A